MTEEFDALGAALRQTPPPDRDARDRALALAMKHFDALQGSPAVSRPIAEPPKPGFLTGVRLMLTSLTSRPALVATTSVAALCLGLVMLNLPLWRSDPDPSVPTQPGTIVSGRTSAPDPALAPALAPGQAPALAPALTKDQQTAAPAAEPAGDVDAQTLVEAAPAASIASPTTAPAGANRTRQPQAEVIGGLAMAAAPANDTVAPPADPDTEAFATADANPVKVTAETPVSTFSIDVDTASWSVIRSSLTSGQLPPVAAVRIEEMVNYFPYTHPAPDSAPFRVSLSSLPTPWNPGTTLVQIALQGRLPAVADRPALNLVFLIDTSGSMDEPNKLPLLKQSLRLLLGQLRPEDQIAIVAYAGAAGEVLAPTAASEAVTIMAALETLSAGGATAGGEGLALAYRIAGEMAGTGEVSRILLATDGDFNVGVSDPEGLQAYVAKQRDVAYLSVLGFGRGNLDDATMQALAQNGNGTAAYIDTLNEAQKVLVDQLSGALFPIANDVKLQVEWNPAQVAEYRLIGYETRALAREDFNNDRVDAGEIGAGHQVTALYEITPPGSPALRNTPLRYGTSAAIADSPDLGFLSLRYKTPGSDTSTLIETPITASPPTEDARFAAAIAGFGQLLQGSVYLNDWGWDAAIALAGANRGDDAFGYRAEAVSLMRLAQSLSN